MTVINTFTKELISYKYITKKKKKPKKNELEFLTWNKIML